MTAERLKDHKQNIYAFGDEGLLFGRLTAEAGCLQEVNIIERSAIGL